MAALASPIVPRASAWVSGLNFQRWSEILKRVVCDVVCMQIRLSGNRVARVGEEEEGGGGSFRLELRVTLVTADVARACASVRVPLVIRVRTRRHVQNDRHTREMAYT